MPSKQNTMAKILPSPPTLNMSGNQSTECTNDYCISDVDYISMIENYIFPTAYEWALIALHVTVFVVGLLGNTLVCASVYRNHSMRTVTNCFIVNLAVADFMVILVCLPPTVLWDVTETWFFGDMLCKTVLYIQSVSVSVSVLTLTFISVDRWYAICYPLRFKSTAVRAKSSIAFIWFVSLLFILPEALVLNTRPNPNLRVDTHYLTDCAYTWGDDSTRVYQLFLLFVLYVAPFIFMSMAYYQIARVLWNKNIPGSTESSHPRRPVTKHPGRNGAIRYGVPNSSCEGQIQSRRKAAKMLIAVVVIFGLCYFPVHLINLLRYTIGLKQSDTMTVFSLLSHWLCYANSAINPVIYNFMSGKFRKEFKKSFQGVCCCRSASYRGQKRRIPSSSLCRYNSSVTQCENIHMNSITRYS